MLEPGQIRAVNLGRQFRISTGGGRSLKATLLRREAASIHEFWALRHVNVDIEPGESFGIVGRNGSGKSTFLKMLARIYGPSEGSCQVGGRLSSLLELGAGFHPEFNAIENVFLSGAVYGIPKRELERDLDKIIAFAELEQFAHQPIKTYSSGMFMRLGFSISMHVRPDILLLDEVFAVGDERFVQKCLARITEYRRNGGTMLLVTHDPNTVKRMCDRAMLLERGEVITVGSSEDVIKRYHKRLVEQGDAEDHSEPQVKRSKRFNADVVVLNAEGKRHHQFVEGEPLSIRIHLTAKAAISNATVGIGIRDILGREITGRSIREIDFKANQERTLELEITDPPLRDGSFLVDIGVADTTSGETLLSIEAAETIAIYAREDGSAGPIQLGGKWNVN